MFVLALRLLGRARGLGLCLRAGRGLGGRRHRLAAHGQQIHKDLGIGDPTETVLGRADHAKASLPEYMVPTQWVFLAALPLTPNGKLDRKALPAPDASDSQQQYVAPVTELERTLAAIWADVLKLERVGMADNFFELGGMKAVTR